MITMPLTDVEAIEVLFISDDPDLAEMFRLKLGLDGYRVRVAGADDALAAARRGRPDMVFLDVPAGRPERLRMLRDLREALQLPELSAIILTGCTGQELESQGVSLSASDYVVRVPGSRR